MNVKQLWACAAVIALLFCGACDPGTQAVGGLFMPGEQEATNPSTAYQFGSASPSTQTVGPTAPGVGGEPVGGFDAGGSDDAQ